MISDGFLRSNQALRNISQEVFETRPNINYVKSFKTAGGLEIDGFAKNKKADMQLWTKLPKRYFQMDFYLATYWHEKELEEHPFLHNVITFNAVYENNTYTWLHRKDHSKFAVSFARDARARICYGDINHTKSHRSGVIICMKDPNLHAAIDQIYRFVVEEEDNSQFEMFEISVLVAVVLTDIVAFILMQ